jgi:hypothetical protein
MRHAVTQARPVGVTRIYCNLICAQTYYHLRSVVYNSGTYSGQQKVSEQNGSLNKFNTVYKKIYLSLFVCLVSSLG